MSSDVVVAPIGSTASPLVRRSANHRPLTPGRVVLHAFLIVMCLVWLFPLAWPIYTALRPVGDTITNGYVSLPAHLSLD
nr:carbohydrate ABC transporter permease [Candidatus Dormibacteraeota bacterium]